MADIAQIKEKTSVLEYAREALGLPVSKSGDRCCSLAGGSNPTAMVVYDDWWYDFKASMGGDVIDLCAVAKHEGDKGRAIRELGGTDTSWVEYTQNLCCQIQAWHESLRQEDREYLASRRITEETITRLKIGYNGRLVFPYFKNGYIAYYVSRDREGKLPKYKKMTLDGLNENIPWGLHTLDRPGVLFIPEGVFDAVSADQENFKVLSPMGGHFSKSQMKLVMSACKEAEGVFLCFDSDDSGSKFQMDMAMFLFRNRIPFTCGKLKEKDVSDFYAAGGDLRELVSSGEDGLHMLCKQLTDKKDFKKFIFSVARFVDKAEVAEILDMVDFPAAWLKEVKKQALSPPPEDLIAKEVVASRQLKFYEALGFYEYSMGAWRRRGDFEVKKHVAEALGHYRTGARINSILTLVKADTVTTELMNQKPIFNFRNCILDLETGETREHSEADMSSMQVGYDYDPEAYAPRWASFIEEITQCDESKANLLQEIAGYVLFPDNSLQKCFFLIGDGRNGKSVYLNTLEAVFGKAQVSNVEMSGLSEPFQRIHLMNSILNISSETHSNVKGAESVFKQVVVGDTISGCYKNKDFVTFQPRTKLISACNEYFKSRDTTTGFLRRVCFVSFRAKYAKSPDPAKGENLMDETLEDRLLLELPGIFNWAYQGYKILRDQKDFTRTADAEELMHGFLTLTNPVVAFIEESCPRGRVSRKDLYIEYKRWANDAGHAPMSRTKFTQQFKQAGTQILNGLEEYRTNYERGFCIPYQLESATQNDTGSATPRETSAF